MRASLACLRLLGICRAVSRRRRLWTADRRLADYRPREGGGGGGQNADCRHLDHFSHLELIVNRLTIVCSLHFTLGPAALILQSVVFSPQFAGSPHSACYTNCI